MADFEFRNESGLKFADISSEVYRIYTFPSGRQKRIEFPQVLNVSKSGGHRLVDRSGKCHYIKPGWEDITWEVFEDKPHFSL